MVGDNKNKQQDKTKNSVELEASLAPAEAEVGAVAKADQQICSLWVIKNKVQMKKLG